MGSSRRKGKSGGGKLWGGIASLFAALVATITPMVSDTARDKIKEILGIQGTQTTQNSPTTSVPNASHLAGNGPAVPEGTESDFLGCMVRLETGPKIRVLSVKPGSLGARLGLVPEDWIEAVDHNRVETLEQLSYRLARVGKFFPADFTIWRGDKKLKGEIVTTKPGELGVITAVRS